MVSLALIYIEISHEEFITILNERDKYEKMKEDIRPIKSSDELNKEEGRKIKTTGLLVKIVDMHKTEKKIIHFFVMYKMLKFTAKAFSKNWAHAIKVNNNDNKSVLLIKIIDIQKKLDVKNIHDLVDQKIKSKF